MIRNRKVCLLLLLCLLPGATAYAVPKQEAAAQRAAKKALGMMRRLAEEKRALETEKTALLERMHALENTTKQLEPLQGELQMHKQQAETLRNNNGTLEARLLSEQQKRQELHRKLSEIVAQAKLIQNDNRLLISAVNEREQWISRCSDKNRQLLEADYALVDKYRDKGFWDKLAKIEPFTGIGRVEVQNTVETYQFKLEDLKVTAFAGKAKDGRRQESPEKNTREFPPGE